MPVTNIQFWADTLEATRLPEISQDIAVLEGNSIETDALLSVKIQEFNDRLDAHTAGITAAQTQANSAQAAAVAAAGSVTAVDLATQAYINSQINSVRDDLTAQVVLAQAQILSNVSAQVTSEMAATVPALTTQLNSALAVADANLATANAHMTAFNTVTDGILNSTLPAFEDLQTTIHSDVATLNGRVNLLLTDFVGDALMPVIDDVRVDAAAEASIAAITATSRMTAGGVSKNPIFTDWSGVEPANADIIVAGTSSFAKNTANARYLNAVDLVGSDATQNGPIIRLDTRANTLDCVPSPERVLVRAEVELVSGSITGGAALKATWGSLVGGVPLSISTLLSNHMTNEVGKVQTIEWYALRTAAFVAGTTPFFQLEIYAVSNLLAATRAVCSLRVHRLDFEVVTANSVASLTMGAATSLSGIQASMIAMRAVAGDAAGSIELVAMSDPTGSASVAKINAKHVEVYASTMRLSDNSNIYPDFDMMDGLFYSSPDAAVITRTGVAAAAIGKNQLNIASNAAARTALSGWFPIEPSVEYLVKGTCWLTGTPVGTATLSIETGSVDASGVVTLISGSNAVVYTRASLGYSAALAEITFIAGSTAKMARFRMARAAGAGSVAAFAGLKVQKKAGASLIVNGSITSNHFNTTSLTAAGLSVFGGSLQSSNFVSGVSGWQITNAGNVEFNNLIVRGSIASGAVSDTYTVTMAGPAFIPAESLETVQLTLNLGPFTPGNVWMRLISFEGYSNVMQEVTLRLYRRIKYGAVWDSWVLLETFTLPLGTGYRPMAATDTLGGEYDDYEYQVRTLGNIGAPSDRYGHFKNLNITAVKLVR